MTTSAIAKELELPRTSVFRIMKTLEVEGMVRSIGKSYVMGHRLINLGLQVVSQIPERDLCVPTNPLSPPRMMLSTTSLKKQIPNSKTPSSSVYSVPSVVENEVATQSSFTSLAVKKNE